MDFFLSLVYIREKKKLQNEKKTLSNFQNHKILKMKP
jgi:hypothetical protein